jgi:GTPase SAR1 family protein
MASKKKPDLKVVILGTSGVGKTCFVQRYLRGQFIANTAEHVRRTLFQQALLFIYLVICLLYYLHTY